MAEKLYEKGITFFINNLNSVNVLSVKNVATNNHYGWNQSKRTSK